MKDMSLLYSGIQPNEHVSIELERRVYTHYDHHLTTPRTIATSADATAPTTDSTLAGTSHDESHNTDDPLSQYESTGTNDNQKRSLAILLRSIGDIASHETRQRERRRVQKPNGERDSRGDVVDPFRRTRGDQGCHTFDER